MNDWGVPMSGLKPAATMNKIMLQSFATSNSSSSGGGLKPISANLSLFRHVDVDLDLDVDVDVLLRNPFSRAS